MFASMTSGNDHVKNRKASTSCADAVRQVQPRQRDEELRRQGTFACLMSAALRCLFFQRVADVGPSLRRQTTRVVRRSTRDVYLRLFGLAVESFSAVKILAF